MFAFSMQRSIISPARARADVFYIFHIFVIITVISLTGIFILPTSLRARSESYFVAHNGRINFTVFLMTRTRSFAREALLKYAECFATLDAYVRPLFRIVRDRGEREPPKFSMTRRDGRLEWRSRAAKQILSALSRGNGGWCGNTKLETLCLKLSWCKQRERSVSAIRHDGAISLPSHLNEYTPRARPVFPLSLSLSHRENNVYIGHLNILKGRRLCARELFRRGEKATRPR